MSHLGQRTAPILVLPLLLTWTTVVFSQGSSQTPASPPSGVSQQLADYLDSSYQKRLQELDDLNLQLLTNPGDSALMARQEKLRGVVSAFETQLRSLGGDRVSDAVTAQYGACQGRCNHSHHQGTGTGTDTSPTSFRNDPATPSIIPMQESSPPNATSPGLSPAEFSQVGIPSSNSGDPAHESPHSQAMDRGLGSRDVTSVSSLISNALPGQNENGQSSPYPLQPITNSPESEEPREISRADDDAPHPSPQD